MVVPIGLNRSEIVAVVKSCFILSDFIFFADENHNLVDMRTSGDI